MSEENYTIVEFLEEHEGYRCGYCKSADGNYSQGMWAHEMTPRDYQDLIDRGWRRSGKYCYKPSMSIMCCPAYTIKCVANDFQLSKSQKKVLKNFTKYIATGAKGKSNAVDEGKSRGDGDDDDDDDDDEPGPSESVNAAPSRKGGDGDASMKSATTSVESLSSATKPTTSSGDASSGKKAPAKGLGADPNKPKSVKAKLLRKEKKLAKKSQIEEEKAPEATSSATAITNTNSKAENVGKSLEDFIEESEKFVDPKVKFEIKLIKSNPPSPEFEETFEESFQLYKKYQMVVHNDEEDKLTVRQFKRFLCHSPLFPVDSGDDSLPFGSYHQHYYVDGRLVAVGVVDLLPSSLSSVYLYYDPDFNFLALGTFGSLREIYFTRQLTKRIPSLKYYYMGFYIHSCQKMRYKGAYFPSFLLCPEANTWHEIEGCRPKLDAHNYSRLNDDPDAEDVTRFPGDLGKVKVLHKGFPMSYEIFRKYKKEANDEDEVRRYAGFVGRSCERILLYRATL